MKWVLVLDTERSLTALKRMFQLKSEWEVSMKKSGVNITRLSLSY
jgi:hypothetical protein